MHAGDWRLRIEDMLDAIAKIDRYTKELTHSLFLEDERTIDAVIRNLIVLGEAARLVPEEIAKQHAGIAWKKLRGLRNLAVHEYFGIDADILWETIRHDLPPLEPMLQKILRKQVD
jgi:uncharacterized protein with HEPN domain